MWSHFGTGNLKCSLRKVTFILLSFPNRTVINNNHAVILPWLGWGARDSCTNEYMSVPHVRVCSVHEHHRLSSRTPHRRRSFLDASCRAWYILLREFCPDATPDCIVVWMISRKSHICMVWHPCECEHVVSNQMNRWIPCYSRYTCISCMVSDFVGDGSTFGYVWNTCHRFHTYVRPVRMVPRFWRVETGPTEAVVDGQNVSHPFDGRCQLMTPGLNLNWAIQSKCYSSSMSSLCQAN